MRQLHAGHAVLDFLPLAWRQALARRAQEGAGLAVILAAAVLGASLASWSIADPSLNHATGGRARGAARDGALAVADRPRRLRRRRAPGGPARRAQGADRPLGWRPRRPAL